MSDTKIKTVIMQGGTVHCPICDNNIKWTCKLETMYTPEFAALNKMPTVCEATPSAHYVSYIMTADGQACFTVLCERCGSAIQTNVLPLIDENNYHQNKKNF